MPHSSTATAARNTLVVIALVATAAIIWQLSQILLIAFAGIVVAILVRAMSRPFGRIPWVGPRFQLALGLISFFAILALIVWVFGRHVSEQVDEMSRLLPQQIQATGRYLDRTPAGHYIVRSIRRMASSASPSIGGFGIAAGAFMGAILDAVLVVFLGVFFAWNPDLYLDGLVRLLPPRQRGRVRDALLTAGAALRSWLIGQLISMGIIGTLAGAGFALIGMPLALALGFLAALFEFIPVAGPILAGIVAVLIGFSKGPRLALSALIVFIILQQIESNVVIPLVQRWAARMPPAVTVLSVLAGGLLLGPMGIVFAVPMAVGASTLIRRLYVEETLERHHRPA